MKLFSRKIKSLVEVEYKYQLGYFWNINTVGYFKKNYGTSTKLYL